MRDANQTLDATLARRIGSEFLWLERIPNLCSAYTCSHISETEVKTYRSMPSKLYLSDFIAYQSVWDTCDIHNVREL